MEIIPKEAFSEAIKATYPDNKDANINRLKEEVTEAMTEMYGFSSKLNDYNAEVLKLVDLQLMMYGQVKKMIEDNNIFVEFPNEVDYIPTGNCKLMGMDELLKWLQVIQYTSEQNLSLIISLTEQMKDTEFVSKNRELEIARENYEFATKK